MAKYSYKVLAGGDFKESNILRKGKLSLEEMQKEVGGYIEIVKGKMHGKTFTMIINEEGKLRELPMNVWATIAFNEALGITDPNKWVDVIAGDVVVEKIVKENKQ
jgi:hypothetical protein|tara:strand:- start:296 stop:610 length:315 start_codon:yes stop_codon:yes gene_type:complete